MVRLIFLAHRYLGIALGLLVTLWCLSGFVMMYVQYPELTREEQLGGLEPLALRACCRVPPGLDPLRLDRFALEMLRGRPVLRLFGDEGQQVLDLASGTRLARFDADAARPVAAAAARAFGLRGPPELLGAIERDQWTVYPSYDPHRPLFHFALHDPPRTELYVSSSSGEVVQVTTARIRFWNWLGAVVHWVYPTVLRRHTALWQQTVIWLSAVSLFLAVLGVWIGLRQYRRRRSGGWSPYRGWALWHHYAGLVFGLFTLTWLSSGLLSLNPWGALEGRDHAAEEQRLRGTTLDFGHVRDFALSLPAASVPVSTVRIEGVAAGGRLSLVAADGDGGRVRLAGGTLAREPLPESYFADAGRRMRPGVPVREAGWLARGDAYYFSHHDARRFPVYRIWYADGERFYLDRISGELALAADRERQWLRWVFHALHRGDFSHLVRSRPAWDLMMWPLLLGVTAGALSGTWMGIRRLVRWAWRPERHPFHAIPQLGRTGPSDGVPRRSR